MSLAEDTHFNTLDRLCWADLTAVEKSDAVFRQLVEGRAVADIVALFSVIYGPIGANQVRGVIHLNGLDNEPAVIAARQRRDDLQRAAQTARARAAKPERIKAAPLPAIDPPRLGNARKKARVTIWDLKAWQCRRPLWDAAETRLEEKFYCGNRRADGSAWCADCQKIVYAPPEERQRNRRGEVTAFPKQGRHRRWK